MGAQRGLQFLKPLGLPPLFIHFFLLIVQEVLLRAQDGPRTDHPDIPYEALRWKAVMLHRVHTDQRPCAAQPCFAVHGDGPGLVLTNVQELFDDGVRGHRAVWKIQIFMSYAISCKSIRNPYSFSSYVLLLRRITKPMFRDWKKET